MVQQIRQAVITPLPTELHDFRNFLYLVWKHLNLPDPTPVQYDIAYWLQHGPKRKVIEAFRGVGKSWITSAYVVWRLRINPQLKFLVVSASKERADAFSTFTLRLIREMPILQCLIPRTEQRESKVAFDVAPALADHSPSVKSVGIFGQLTGTRADEIIADDVEVPNNAFTQGMREKLSESVKEFDAILKPGEHTRVTYLGTPQTEMSLYNILPERGYTIRIWPAKYPKKDEAGLYGANLAPYIIEALEKAADNITGKPTDPKRFNEMDLLEREASYGRSGFALQFMLDTRLSDETRYPLKLRDLIVMSLNPDKAPENLVWAAGPDTIHKDLQCVGMGGDRYYGPMRMQGEWIDYTGTVMAIDPSGRGKDETGYAVVKMLNGFLYVVEAGGLSGGYDDAVLTTLAEIAKRRSVNRILIEANFGDGMFTQLFKPFLGRIYPCTTEEVKHSIQKERRIIDTLEPVMNQHRLVVDREVIESDINSTKLLPVEQQLRYQLFYQMSRITKDRGCLGQDDRLDALAIAVAYWVEQMAQDAQDRIVTRRDELLDRELEQFTKRTKESDDLLLMGYDEKNLTVEQQETRRKGAEIRGRQGFGGRVVGNCLWRN